MPPTEDQLRLRLEVELAYWQHRVLPVEPADNDVVAKLRRDIAADVLRFSREISRRTEGAVVIELPKNEILRDDVKKLLTDSIETVLAASKDDVGRCPGLRSLYDETVLAKTAYLNVALLKEYLFQHASLPNADELAKKLEGLGGTRATLALAAREHFDFRYKTTSTIRQSRQAEVCLADDHELQRRVVKKQAAATGGVEAKYRLHQEAALTAKLRHPSIPSVFGTGVDQNGIPWFAMEFIDGVTVHDLGRSEGAAFCWK